MSKPTRYPTKRFDIHLYDDVQVNKDPTQQVTRALAQEAFDGYDPNDPNDINNPAMHKLFTFWPDLTWRNAWERHCIVESNLGGAFIDDKAPTMDYKPGDSLPVPDPPGCLGWFADLWIGLDSMATGTCSSIGCVGILILAAFFTLAIVLNYHADTGSWFPGI